MSEFEFLRPCADAMINQIRKKWAMVYERSGAGNRHFCNLLAKTEDHINMTLNLFFTGNAIQSCYGRLKSTGGRNKNGIFRVYTVKNDRNSNENDVIRGPSLGFVSHVCTESAIFAPDTGRLLIGASSGSAVACYDAADSHYCHQSGKCCAGHRLK